MKIKKLTLFAILLGIEIIFCFTPLGSLPALGPIVMTLAMIPVIVTGLFMDVKYASLMGFFAGLFSFMVWTFMPPSPMAFVFTPFYSFGEISGNFFSLIICFVPRILTGTFTALAIKKTNNFGLAAFIGSMTNTIGVMLGIALFFGELYSSLLGQSLIIIIGTTVLTNGVPEAILAVIVAVIFKKAFKNRLDMYKD